jgi:3-phenylpropionate/trans-cinnamate dioxygenase ferredoxin reductase subunit
MVETAGRSCLAASGRVRLRPDGCVFSGEPFDHVMSSHTTVIVGAGHAGFQLAVSLRQSGYEGAIRLVNGEAEPPYQRPPLSKTYLKGEGGIVALAFRPETFFSEQRIDLIADHAIAINRAAKRVRLAAGAPLGYDHLVLATGAANRPLPLRDARVPVSYIRSFTETEDLRLRLAGARHVVVVGAGFIGLEFAATARARGLAVDVVELGPRPMARAVSPEIAGFFQARLEAAGVRFHLGAQIAEAVHGGGRVSGVTLDNGTRIAADCIVAGIGILPNTTLAVEAGLEVHSGVVVDDLLVTADPNISAIGDVALFPCRHAGGPARLESVQNATDQARCVAARLVGKPRPYDALPWFWSDQGPDKLQIAGLFNGFEHTVLRGAPEDSSFSVLCYKGEQLIAIESVNRAGDHVAGRKILGAGGNVTPAQAADPDFDLRAAARA